MATTTLALVTGELLEVDGSVQDVAKQLENTARSGSGMLAWLNDVASEQPVAVNPARVVTVRPGAE
jgi:hypothetical protein